jgi:hypothetical protein
MAMNVLHEHLIIFKVTNIGTVQAFEVVYGNVNLLSWTLF